MIFSRGDVHAPIHPSPSALSHQITCYETKIIQHIAVTMATAPTVDVAPSKKNHVTKESVE